MDLLAQTDPLAAARAHKAGGGRVVGFMSNNVPVELIHAAGCFPLQLPPAPREPTPLADAYMEVLFDPLVRSVFEGVAYNSRWLLDTVERETRKIAERVSADVLAVSATNGRIVASGGRLAVAWPRGMTIQGRRPGTDAAYAPGRPAGAPNRAGTSRLEGTRST